jgi:CRP-like cAMP-binding protein
MEHDLNSILKAIPLFKTLEQEEVTELAKLMARQEFAANQPIMVEGHPPPGLYVILDGRVAVMKGKGDKGDHICDLDAGECVGEVEIIEHQLPCAASVVADGEVKNAVIVAENLNGFFERFPNAAVKILRQMVIVLASRLRRLNVNYSSLMSIAESLGD